MKIAVEVFEEEPRPRVSCSGQGCTKSQVPHAYVPPRRAGKKKLIFCSLFYLFLVLYNARHPSNTCQIFTTRTRGEHLCAAEGWWAWLHLTIVEGGAEFIATVRNKINKLISSDLSYFFVVFHDFLKNGSNPGFLCWTHVRRTHPPRTAGSTTLDWVFFLPRPGMGFIAACKLATDQNTAGPCHHKLCAWYIWEIR